MEGNRSGGIGVLMPMWMANARVIRMWASPASVHADQEFRLPKRGRWPGRSVVFLSTDSFKLLGTSLTPDFALVTFTWTVVTTNCAANDHSCAIVTSRLYQVHLWGRLRPVDAWR